MKKHNIIGCIALFLLYVATNCWYFYRSFVSDGSSSVGVIPIEIPIDLPINVENVGVLIDVIDVVKLPSPRERINIPAIVQEQERIFVCGPLIKLQMGNGHVRHCEQQR